MPTYATSGAVSSVAPTGTLTLDALIGGDKWGGAGGTGITTVSYSFPWPTSGSTAYWYQDSHGDYSPDNEPSAQTHYGLSATQTTAARAALQAWANVANLQFQEVADNVTTVGDIRFAWSSAVPAGFWGYTYYPAASLPQGGDIWLNTSNTGATDTNWSVGSYNYEALMHEIGHALGLKHPNNYSGTEQAPFFSGSTAYLDNRLYTLMSYNDPAHDLYRDVTFSGGAYHFSYPTIDPQTPMVLDIAVIQYLYGANTTYHAGDDTYTFDPTSPFFKTIWDAGGHDTISVSNFTHACTIDLTPGDYSSISIPADPLPAGYTGGTTPTYDGTDNLGIAYGAIIEDAIGGSGNDTLIGNTANNTLTGGGGSDAIDGASGIDVAKYTGARANFTLAKTATGYTVADHVGAEGTDTLANIERLQFADKKIAIDLSGTGHAAETVEILGAAFGKSYTTNKDYVAVGLNLFDAGTSFHDICVAAIGTSEFKALAGSTSNVAFVNTVYDNVVGVFPQQADLNYYVGQLQGSGGTLSQADLLGIAATCTENLSHIDLVGLQQSGVEYA